MKVIVFDDGKLPNLAMMKVSTFYKAQGYEVCVDNIAKPSQKQAELAFCSVIFTKNRAKAEKLKALYPNIQFGGTGIDRYDSDPPVISQLPEEIEQCLPDYDLYAVDDIYPRIKGIMTRETRLKKAQMIVDAGIGFSSRGCIRKCGFCVVPKKEGRLYQDSSIKDIINPRSNIIFLMDNNLTADPDCVEKLKEIKERNLIVEISSGIDIRLLTPEKAKALSEVKMLGKVHYAWDLMASEKQVWEGINILSQFTKRWRHMCFMLVGFNTTFEQDMYRFRKLTEAKIDPYVMRYNDIPDERLSHFERWVNSRIYKKASFEEYRPWVKYQAKTEGLLFTA